MAPLSLRSELRALRRDLRWIAVVWLLVGIGVCSLLAIEREPIGRVITAFVAWIAIAVALTPVVWLRWHRRPSGRGETAQVFKLLALALGWCAVSGVVLYAVVSLVETALA